MTARDMVDGLAILTAFGLLAIVATTAAGAGADRLFDPMPPVVSSPGKDTRTPRERAERESRWVERCKPEVVAGPNGVGRYRYAAPDCEYGD